MTRMLTLLAGISSLLALSGCTGDWFGKMSDPVISGQSEQCYDVTKENALHPLVACDLGRRYQVRVGDKVYNFGKAEFHARFLAQLKHYFHSSTVPATRLGGNRVDFWLAAPVFQPDAAYWVAVVATDDGNLSVRLPLSMDEWTFDHSKVAWLGKEDHPTMLAKRVDQLTLTPQPHLSARDMLQFVRESGVLARTDPLGRPIVQDVVGDGSMILLKTAPFGAPQLARYLQRQPEARLRLLAVNFSPVAGVDSYQAKVFRFFLSVQSNR